MSHRTYTTPLRVSASKTHSYRTGSSINVSKVEVTSPPMTTEAKGRCTSEPIEVEKAMGKKPMLATQAASIPAGAYALLRRRPRRKLTMNTTLG
jgi:hypothetical protein